MLSNNASKIDSLVGIIVGLGTNCKVGCESDLQDETHTLCSPQATYSGTVNTTPQRGHFLNKQDCVPATQKRKKARKELW